MKKKVIISLLILILLGGVFYFNTYYAYEQSTENLGFPIPKKAELIEKNSNTEIYEWSKASEENGIPASYEFIIKNYGWEKVDSEGALVVYEKDDLKIELISSTKQLTIISK